MKKQHEKISGLLIRIFRQVKVLNKRHHNQLCSKESSTLVPDQTNLNSNILKFQQIPESVPHPGNRYLWICSGLLHKAVTITIIKLPLYSLREMPAPIYLQCWINHKLLLIARGKTARVQCPPPGGHSVVNIGGLPMI